ncbi:MAG: polyribonucleotide nucleotidyltransferase, partial [Desulfatiglandales bacterium]
FRRDMGRPSEQEILVSRLIDRPIRPLFPHGFNMETQVIASVLSTDKENEADILAILGASAALNVSEIPFQTPIAAVRVGRIDGRLKINPTRSEQGASDLNLVVAGNKNGIVMVEGGANFLSEGEIVEALFYAHESIKPLIQIQEALREEVGKEKRPFEMELEGLDELLEELESEGAPLLREVVLTPKKKERAAKRQEVTKRILESLGGRYEGKEALILSGLSELEKRLVREMILREKRRIDGRSFTEVRPIDCMVGVLPRVHGSALFTRGETQALVVTTLGTEFDEQRVESIYGDYTRYFMFHYNFPPFSVGEVRRLSGPGRREIGHGALAQRALSPVMPSHEKFSYCVRVVSEILESNGSSSMASVCGGSLSLMDAGVPIKEAVAGVAMGLVIEGDEVAVLTDIIGDEDHYGDMDFKVAGTKDGVTALQMDIKTSGITREVLERALNQAKEARLFILDKMNNTIPRARAEVSKYAPYVTTITIKPERVRDIIGPGGKTVRDICSNSNCKIELSDDGKVLIAGPDKASVEKAIDLIKALTKEAEPGKIYTGKVVKITDFGAFVEILPGVDGLIHISQLDKKRIAKVSDVLKEGDEVMVKVLEIDQEGRVRLSRKAVLEELGEDV